MGKPIILPTKPEELGREGLLWLVRNSMLVLGSDLRFARLYELNAAAQAASEKWRASLPVAEAARNHAREVVVTRPGTSRGLSALRRARDADEAAEANQARLWRACQRASAAVNEYWLAMDEAREDA